MNRLCDLNLKQLKEYIKNKDVYCFGCGIQGKRMAMLFENWGLQKNLKGYIDNDRKKIGTQIEIENNIYNIYSIEMVKHMLTSNTMILVTCLDYKGVY